MPIPLRVLLVEDNEDDAELLLRELRRGGYEPHARRVDDAAALVAALERHAWELITCDWVMPQLSAPRALDIVRGRGGDAALIVVSGEVGEEFAVTAMKAGAHDFISKQRLARLVPAVARELRDAETRRARRVAEAALAEREAALRRQVIELETLYRTAPVGMALIDRDLRYVRINEMLARFNGLPVSAHLGRRIGAVLPQLSEIAEPVIRQVFDSGEAVRGVEIDGRVLGEPIGERSWRVDYYPVTGVDGSVIGVSAIVADISERKRVEAQLRAQADELGRLNADLEARVIARTTQLEAANAELRSFTSSVSHDLRAPLRAITGFATALHEDCDRQLDDVGKLYLERLRSAAGRLGALFDALLALARITQRDLDRVPVDLSALAEEIAGELRRGEPSRRVELHIAPRVVAKGDPVLLRAALANLLGNAWKFTRGRAAARIEFGVEAASNGPVFFVRDDGVGFDPAAADRLFRPFVRLHGEAEFEGTGIGLTTVQRIIHRHGGRVWADAAPGRGATFYFTLG